MSRRSRKAEADERTARPKLPGRSLEPVSNAGSRGMIVTPKLVRKHARGGQNSAYGRLRHFFTFDFRPFTFYFLTSTVYPMPLYVVTGGAGFIGSHLTEELLRRGEQVRVADSLITGHRANLAHLSGVDFLQGDLADLAVAKRAVQDADYVLHQAAIPSVPRSVDDPITSNRANIDSTLNVLVAARDAGVKRVVYAGSSSAYGNTPTLPKREDMPANPLSPYALQKLVGEQYCQMFTQLYGFETVTIRYFNVFGPRQDPAVSYTHLTLPTNREV